MSGKLDLTKLLSPQSVAVIGASTNAKSISGQPLMHMLASHYEGRLYPVNPNRAEVQGLKAYPDVLSVPRPCDAAVIAVPAAHVPAAIEQCGEAGIPYAVVLTAGFVEAGEDENQKKLEAAIAKSGVRIVGPNCVGTMNVITRAYLAFGGALGDKTLKPGPLAIVSQSGGFGQSMMTFANLHGIGCNYVISCGNETDITFFDFAHDFLERDEVKLLATYMEASTEGTKLRELGRHALEVGKPILMLKVGNTTAGRRAASSHTGRLTADYTLFRAAFREGGYMEVHDLDELADVARLVIGGKYPKGRNVGVLTGSGGWGVIVAEHLEKNGLSLPAPSEESKAKLLSLKSTFASINNPIDQMANYGEQYKTLEAVIDDPAFDQFFVRSGQGPDVRLWAERFIELAGKSDKPIVINWPSIPTRDTAVREMLEQAGYLWTNYAGRGARAAGIVTDFALRLRDHRSRRAGASARPIEKRDLPAVRPERGNAESKHEPAERGALSETASKACLAQYGIRVTNEALLSLEEVEALKEAPLAFPVAVKLASPDIPHKTEADAVRLGIRDLEALKRAAAEVRASGLKHTPNARVEGISIQEMASGVEVILGAVNDPGFGPYVMVGLGGVLTEVLHDVAHRFAPVAPEEAHDMIAELKGAQVLQGFRGAPPADIDALADAIVKLSWLIADHADAVTEIDVNPLFVRPQGEGVTAADALVVTGARTP
jgi:acyl-CoA synthetase (NDP forming)